MALEDNIISIATFVRSLPKEWIIVRRAYCCLWEVVKPNKAQSLNLSPALFPFLTVGNQSSPTPILVCLDKSWQSSVFCLLLLSDETIQVLSEEVLCSNVYRPLWHRDGQLAWMKKVVNPFCKNPTQDPWHWAGKIWSQCQISRAGNSMFLNSFLLWTNKGVGWDECRHVINGICLRTS